MSSHTFYLNYLKLFGSQKGNVFPPVFDHGSKLCDLKLVKNKVKIYLEFKKEQQGIPSTNTARGEKSKCGGDANMSVSILFTDYIKKSAIISYVRAINLSIFFIIISLHLHSSCEHTTVDNLRYKFT